MAFTENTIRVSETQNGLVKQLRKNNAFHINTYSYMKISVDNLNNDVKTIDPNDPNLYNRIDASHE